MSKKGELLVYGFNSVKSLCENKKDEVLRLYFTKEVSKHFGDMCRHMASKKRFYKMVEEKSELEKLSASIHHQGIVAVIKEPIFKKVNDLIIDEWVKNEEDVLFTDSVGNANNLGAIIRSMAFFGVKNIVIPVNEVQSHITSATYRTAEGGMSFVNVFLCHSIKDFILKCRGKMKIITTDVKAHHEIKKMSSFVEAGDSVLLVLGNEVEGVSEYIKKQSNYLVKVKGVGNMESLNVAQTATLFLHKLSQIKCTLE